MVVDPYLHLLEQSPVLVLRWKKDSERTILAVSGGIQFANALDFQVGHGFMQWIHSDDREHIAEKLEDNNVFPLSYRLHADDNSMYWVTEYSQTVSSQKDEQEGVLLIQLNAIAEQKIRQRLDRCEQELQDFAYIASHDMKEPLRKIQAFGDLLHNKFASELGEQGEDYLARMLNATLRLQNFLDGLLEFSRITTRAAAPQSSDLGLICSTVVTQLHKKIDQLQARIAVGKLPMIEADAKQIHQLVFNLLDNSLKFHIEGVRPIIGISAIQAQAQVWISIQDNGVGFKQQDESKVFQMFQRLHGRSQYPGSGIGLAICRKIVERHGGEIHAKSAPGRGATFIFSLPLHSSLPENNSDQK